MKIQGSIVQPAGDATEGCFVLKTALSWFGLNWSNTCIIVPPIHENPDGAGSALRDCRRPPLPRRADQVWINKRSPPVGDHRDLTPEEHKRRGDAADALFGEPVRWRALL